MASEIRMERSLSLLIAQIVYRVLIDFGPFLRYDVEQFVLHIPLDNDFVVTGHRRAACKFRAKKLGRHFQINVKCAETGDHCDTLLFAARRPRHAYFLRCIVLALFGLHHALAAALLTLLVILAGTAITIVDLQVGEFGRQILL